MIWLVLVFFPLLLACLLGVPALRRFASGVGLWLAPLPALGAAMWGGGLEPGFFPALFLETTLHFGPYGRLFLLLAGLLWTASGLFAWSSSRSDDFAQGRFALFFLFTLSGNLGVCVAQDLASFYVFFALMSFAAYGLIVHDQTLKALYAGRVYLIMAVIGEVLLATAFFYAGIAGESLLFADIAERLPDSGKMFLILVLAFIGFGIKAGVIALHLWLPLAHPAAPTSASAVLSGVMIKAGLLGWLQVFPLGAVSIGLGWGVGVAWLGLLAAIYGAVSGVLHHDPKTILAYSSISQMGLMTMAFGFALVMAGPDAALFLPVLLLFVLAHGLAKGALFLGVGVAKATRYASTWGFLVLSGLVAAGLVLAGMPFTAGSVVKQGLKTGAGHLPEVWTGFFGFMLSLTAVATTLILAVFVWRVRQGMVANQSKSGGTVKVAGRGMFIAWAGLLVLLMLGVPLLHTVLATYGPDGSYFVAPSLKTFWDGVWPIGLGLVAAASVLHLDRRRGKFKGLDELLLEALQRAAVKVRSWCQDSPLCDPGYGTINLVAWSDRLFQSRWMRTVPDRIERRLLYWHTVGLLFVGFLLVFLALTLMELW